MEQEDQDKVLNTRWNKKMKKIKGTKYTMEQEDKIRY